MAFANTAPVAPARALPKGGRSALLDLAARFGDFRPRDDVASDDA